MAYSIAHMCRQLYTKACPPRQCSIDNSCFLQAVDAIDWPEGFVRRDIGWRAIERM